MGESPAHCIEECSRGDATTGVIFEVHNALHAEPIYKHGTAEQKRRFLPPLCRGEAMGAYALTEPGTGSDAAAISTTASRVEGGWRLNGRKTFITNGGEADEHLVYAVTDKARGSHGITCFIVQRDFPGVTCGRPIAKLGIRASATTDLILEDVLVPDDRVLGEVNGGYRIALQTLHGGRIGIAAQAIGIVQASLDNAVEYALRRETFKEPIAEHQSIQWHMAEMATELEAARWLLYRAAWLHGEEVRATKEISMAKLFASRVAVAGTLRGIQILGGYGYTNEYPQERYLRDAKITEIYEGTSEIQRLVIARALLGEYRSRQPWSAREPTRGNGGPPVARLAHTGQPRKRAGALPATMRRIGAGRFSKTGTHLPLGPELASCARRIDGLCAQLPNNWRRRAPY